jgi:hypothetical protein
MELINKTKRTTVMGKTELNCNNYLIYKFLRVPIFYHPLCAVFGREPHKI